MARGAFGRNVAIGAILILIFTAIGISMSIISLRVAFWGAILSALALMYIASFSIFLPVILFSLYPLLAQYHQIFYGSSYGVLEYVVSNGLMGLYSEEFLLSYIIFLIPVAVYLGFADDLAHEKNMIRARADGLQTSEFGYWASVCCAIFGSVIAFPTMPFTYDVNERFNALLPGNAWNMFAIVALIFVYFNAKHRPSAWATMGFVVFWFLTHYERVDIIGFMLGIFIVTMVRRGHEINLRFILKFGPILVAVFWAVSSVGYLRNDAVRESSSLLKSIFVQTTAADIAYVFNISIDFVKVHGTLNGQYLHHYIIDLLHLPFEVPSATQMLESRYAHPGGEYILTEPFMNGGYFGVFVFSIIMVLTLRWLIRRTSVYGYFLYVFLLMYVPRISWYGVGFVFAGLTVLLPAFYLLNRIPSWGRSKSSKGLVSNGAPVAV